MAIDDRQFLVCASSQLAEKKYAVVDLLYKNSPHTGIVFRFNGEVFAYLNQCVHMPKALNCERDTIFDERRELLRCSMHGIVYDPITGESLSTMCNGDRLNALRLNEVDGSIYIRDKRVRPFTNQVAQS